MDEVCSEIGQEWRRLCRKMGFSDGECEQFRQDFHVSGTYEITYQVCVMAITKTCPCNMQRIFSAVKLKNLFGKNLIFLILLFET